MPELPDPEPKDAMNKPMTTLGAAAAGALAMYYLDPDLGARRRALLADLVRSGLPGDGPSPRARLRHRAGALRTPAADPQGDAELRSSIQSALDRMVSHPRALDVSVADGVVRLSGRVLASERDGLIAQVQRMPGVLRLVNAMSAHDDPQEIARPAAPVSLAPASR